jgi:hypothetical protein
VVVKRHVIDPGALEQPQAIVDLAADMHDFGMPLQLLDRGEEARPLQALAVQLAARRIGGRDQRDATRKQQFEQRAEDHGIRDVRHEQFIEADHAGTSRKVVCHQGQRVGVRAVCSQFGMHVGHEAMEVPARLLLERQALVE